MKDFTTHMFSIDACAASADALGIDEKRSTINKPTLAEVLRLDSARAWRYVWRQHRVGHRVQTTMTAPSNREMAVRVAGVSLWLAWQIVRLPILALLLVLEPVVRFVLSMLTLCSVLTVFLFEFSGVVPNFPFWLMFGFAVGCALALIAYEGAIRVFAK